VVELIPPPSPPESVRGHQFPLTIMRQFLRCVLEGAASLRTAAWAPCLCDDEAAGEESRLPTPQCGRLWLLRVGLYEVQRPKERADDWVWIIDHTVQLGPLKVLLIVGLRLSHWQQGPLGHHDLQVILMQPIEKSDGDVVQTQLEQAAELTGVPREILSDGCRELNKGIRQFCQDHPQTTGVQDLKHKLARLLEAELTADPCWPEFLKTCAHLRKKTQQTEWAILSPPATKEKARFMNLDELVRWAARTRVFLDAPQFPPDFAPSRDRLEELAGPLRQYDANLPEWHEMIELISASMEEVRQHGYHRGSVAALQSGLPAARTPAGGRLREKLLQFVGEQSAQAKEGEHLVGSSEVIESLIGKGKRIEGQHSKGGFTRMILGMAAAVVRPTVANIRAALECVRTVDVHAWATQHLGPSLHALRLLTLGHVTAEQIQDKLTPPTATGF
jgi:hypothetical protein